MRGEQLGHEHAADFHAGEVAVGDLDVREVDVAERRAAEISIGHSCCGAPSGRVFDGQKRYPSFSSRSVKGIFTDAVAWPGCKASETCRPSDEKCSQSRRG